MNKNNFMKGALATTSGALSMIAMASAQTTNTGTLGPNGPVGKNLQDLVALVQSLIGPITGILIAITIIVFFWGLIKFIFSHDGKGKEGAIKYMGYALLALFIEVSIWGIIYWLGSATGIQQGGKAPIPQVPVQTGVYNGANY